MNPHAQCLGDAAAPSEQQKFTAFHAIDDAQNETRVLRNRVEALANRLAGSVPEEPGNPSTAHPAGIGLIDATGIVAVEIKSNLSACNVALARIEKLLP